MDNSNQYLGTERIGKLMKQYALPCIISLLVGALYNIVDQIYIANASYLGSYGNAANTVVFPLTVVALAIAVMIGDGCCAFVSICLGKQDIHTAKSSVGCSVIMTVISALILTAVYLIFSDQILAMFGGTVNPETFHHAKEYFFYISLGIPFYMFGQAMNPIIRGDGNPKFAMGSTGQKYVCCNADEGDPGAFMDRSVLEGDPHCVFEAMAIAGYVIGSDQGYIYVRAEYPIAIDRLNIALKQAREAGLLGKDIFGTGFNFDIDLRLGAGAFVCGEETALMTSIEGNRGEPRPRPPFPAVKGLFEKPTILNNVETWANIPRIIMKGADWFAGMGTERSKGTKVFALGGKINNVGLVEIPMGTTLREIVEEIGGGVPNGKKFKAAQTGGPSGGCIPASNFDVEIDYDNLVAIGSMMGSGGLIVMDEDDCMVDIAKFFLEFTVDESCGKCTPCRIGTKRLLEILNKITEGKAEMSDLDQLKRLAALIQQNSLCALGQTAPNPVLSTLKHFEDEYIAHIVDKKCPAGKCKSLMQYKIDPEKCIGCGLCAKNCPAEAITGEKKKPYTIDPSKCVKCGVCISKCKKEAVYKA